MGADSSEHVISYWIIFEKFHSPALGGYAVISHWLPFLLFSIYSGALADRFDPRRIIQVGTPSEIYNNPRDIFVAGFVGSPAINLLEGSVAAGKAVITTESFELPNEASVGEGRYTFGIRPADVRE